MLSVNERFDINQVTVVGSVQKLWGRGEDVFARLRVSNRGLSVEGEDAQSTYVTLRFQNGSADGAPVTLQPGDSISVRGYLTHTRFDETLRKFLDAAGAPNFIEYVPSGDLSLWRGITFKRFNTILNVVSLSSIPGEVVPAVETKKKSRKRKGDSSYLEDNLSIGDINKVVIEGVVAKVWEYRRNEGKFESIDLYARLAVYDDRTMIDEKGEGNFGRPRRRPHYVNVRFQGGKTSSGVAVKIAAKNRARVTGQLRDQGKAVSLHEALLATGDTAVMEAIQRLPDADRLHEIKAQEETLHVLCDAVVIYAERSG
jgi:hypothetical protein